MSASAWDCVKKRYLILPSCLLLACFVQAADLKTLQIPKAQASIRIDGNLGGHEWQNALILPLAYETYPGENTQPPVRTECKVTYDDDNLYVAFHAFDPNPTEIRAHLADRDHALNDDSVTFSLDTFNDQRRSFDFDINPLGVQSDSFNGDSSWDAIWNSAGRIVDDGFEVEAAIPFSSLRFPNTDEDQTWGFTAIRYYPRSANHEISLVPVDRNDTCYQCHYIKLVGFSGIKPGRNIELTPTVTSLRSDERIPFPNGPLNGDGFQSEAGLSARWGITSSMNLNAAVNPDFSQVEADALQLTINTRFALYYTEKRPFFLENADLFQTPVEAVYTRSVADPSWGLKLTGKLEKNAVGMFVARDDNTNLIFPSNQYSFVGSLEEPSVSSAVRYRRDVLKDSTVGVLVTDREGGNYYNRLLGTDANIRLSDSDSIGFHWLGSSTQYPRQTAIDNEQPQDAFQGSALQLSYSHTARNWEWWADYSDLGEGFRADMGFISRVDTRGLDGGAAYILWPERNSWITTMRFSVFASQARDHEGTVTDDNISALASWSGPLQSRVAYVYRKSGERFEKTFYDKPSHTVTFTLKPSGRASFYGYTIVGDAVDYDNARPGRSLSALSDIQLSLGRHFKTNLTYNYDRLRVQEGKLYGSHRLGTTIQYQINIRSFFRAIVQYSHLMQNAKLYLHPPSSRSQRVFTQLLYSYKLSPRTLFFAGYSDTRHGYDEIPVTRSARSFFLKLSYNWLV